MRAYWRTCGHRHGNFGDELTRLIVEHVLGAKVDRAAEMDDADLISIGSILGEIPWSFQGCVWGAGAMFDESVIDLPNAWICAVRGPLSARRVVQGAPVALGDPGLLAGRALAWTLPRRRYELSIVPHYVDMDDPALAMWVRRNPWVHVIDPCGPVDEVVEQIAGSAAVLSSSLHGLIVADAFGVPNRWVKFGDRLAGGTFKFRDYYAAFGIFDPIPMQLPEGRPPSQIIAGCQVVPRDEVERVCDGLLDAFPHGASVDRAPLGEWVLR